MKNVRHITSVIIIILITVLAAGTIVEKLHGSDFARIHVYSAWWFVALWALVALLIVYMAVKCKTWKRLAVCALHSSILLILAGALLTMLTGQHGRMKLEPNRPNSHFFIEEKGGEITKEALPFSLTLDRFEIETYESSNKPKDYVSYLKLTDGETQQDIVISMNNILKHKHYRFYQSDYDEQGNSILDVARDPWGIALTYTGYALLFIALAAILIEKRKMFRAVTWSWISVLVVLAIVLHVRMLTRQLMPVLRSPFFSLHISTIITAYALLIGIAVVGIIALIKPKDLPRLERMKSLSTAMLYPAVALLAAGIFIGAIWANVSWGNYWSWDPKEVWALITLLIYAAPLHERLLKTFQKPLFFHIYGIVAILSVVITYFGVNLLLGGVHAYN
ncbi:MAG: cytochrome c biogenesis protein CcsA [Bacteroidales bacterium]|nr:cytochrome c biogenesis protein CcsA [Bacteroidales bacterium]